ncbi:MAG: hypothetical protein KDC24_10940, partial [Saprospiraceae bacterium]|nr:hypothetical protein [Saprospiraceae bacterium]
MQFLTIKLHDLFLMITYMKYLITLVLAIFSQSVFAQNNIPVISNLTVEEDEDAGLIVLQYDLSDAEMDPCNIEVFYSPPGRKTHAIKLTNATGAVGSGIVSGTGKIIYWPY